MAEEQKPIPKDDNLGVSFDETQKESEEQKKTLDPKVFEVANKHLAPTRVPGQENVFNVSSAFNEDPVEIGTIVSDKKHHKTPLGKSLKSAFAEWWGKTRTSLDHSLEILEEKMDEKQPNEKPSDSDRTETVEKAKAGTVQPPKEDHHVIIEKSKTLEKDASRVKGVPFNIKDEPQKPATWESSQKPEQQAEPPAPSKPRKFETPDLRKDMIAPVVGTRIKKDISSFDASEKDREEVVEKKVKETDVQEKQEERKKTEVPRATLPPIKPEEKEKVRPAPVFVSPKVTTRSEYLQPQKASPAVSHTPLPEEESLVSRENETAPKSQKEASDEAPTLEEMRARLSSQSSFSAPKIEPTTHEITPPEQETVMHFERPPQATEPKSRSPWRIFLWGFALLALLGVSAIGILYGISLSSTSDVSEGNTSQATETEPPQIKIPSFFNPDRKEPISLPDTKSQFLSTLKDVVQDAPDGVTQFYPVRQTETVMQNVRTEELFEFLNTGLKRNVVNSLEDVSMLGAVTTLSNEPFIIIRSYNFDVLFAGMLAWEKTMYDDLTPLFGTGVLERVVFVDAIRSNSPIRILYDNEEKEVMLYAFINRNTVIITSSTAALAEILTHF